MLSKISILKVTPYVFVIIIIIIHYAHKVFNYEVYALL